MVEFFNNANTFICFLNIFIDNFIDIFINFVSKNRPRCFSIFSFIIGKLLKKIAPQVVYFFYEKKPFFVFALRYLDETTSSIDKPIDLFLTSLNSEIVILF